VSNRRRFITLLGGGVAAWPLAARAQQGERMRQIGVLMGYAENDSEARAWVAAFREGLQKLGWTEGRSIRIDTRWAAVDAEVMQRFAQELVALQPDLILSQITPTTAALLQQTRTIPIVFAMVADPVGSGFVASLSRPGGNATGFATNEGSLSGKWLELLKEIAPRVVRVANAVQPDNGVVVCRILPKPLQSRRCVFRSGGDRGARSRHVRARIRRCRTGSRTE
jgi:putative tryptophan/tyrosine transport system substrate-binding protein